MHLTLDALLLYILTVPIVMKYRILPIDGTPYWLFGLLFLLLTGNVLISVYPDLLGRARKHLESIKNIVLWMVIVIVLGCVSITAMVDRARTAPVYGVHDIILQQEAAMRHLLVGKNPYTETYFGTPVESFNYDEPGNTEAVNPALYHFVMPPWYVLFPFGFYYTVRPVFGFFDGRFASLFSMIGILLILALWFRNKVHARIAMTLTAFSPAVFDYFLEGRSDVFALFWLVCGLWLLEKRKFVWSAVVMALAFMSKQTTWFIAPLYAFWLWKSSGKNLKQLLPSLAAGLGVVALLTIPFIMWDAKGFFDSVIFYLSGNTPHSYPVSGYGLSMVLRELGFIRDIHAYYPFAYWQIGLGLPAVVFLLMWLNQKTTMSTMLLTYALLLSVIWYTSRYFNNSHLGYISMIIVLGLLKESDSAHT